MAQVLVLDVERDEIRMAEVSELDDYYRELGCDCFDIAHRRIGNKMFDIFVDDCGLLRDDPIISAIDSKGSPMLVGNLIIANHEGPETTSLTEEDVAMIYRNLVKITTKSKDHAYIGLMCEYQGGTLW